MEKYSQFYPARVMSDVGVSTQQPIMKLGEENLDERIKRFGLPEAIKEMKTAGPTMAPIGPSAVEIPNEPMSGRSEIGTKLAIGAPSEALRTEALDTTTQAAKAAEPAKAATDMGYGSAGIMAGAGLLGSLGKAISESGIQQMKAKQGAISGFGKAQQEAMSKAGTGKYGALAQLIAAYRGALK